MMKVRLRMTPTTPTVIRSVVVNGKAIDAPVWLMAAARRDPSALSNPVSLAVLAVDEFKRCSSEKLLFSARQWIRFNYEVKKAGGLL